jgi:hypothetical protein
MRLYIIIIFLLCHAVSFSQEQLVAPASNPAIKEYLLNNPSAAFRSAFSASVLDLPLIDDFSGKGLFPDTAIWTDNYIYVNCVMARNPVSVGVATFDGLNQNGDAYVGSNPLAQGSCDTLTSKPIFLLTRPGSQGGGQWSAADSVTLGFFYEKKGWGDAPDNTDSLVLEFYNPSTDHWSRQWFTKGGLSAGQDSIFSEVNIRISDTAYFKDGFRFRFRNFGAQTGALDHWHLDYVRLYKAYNSFTGQMDTVLSDVAMVYKPVSLLNEFTAVPWDHYKTLAAPDQQAMMRSTGDLIYRNNGNTLQDIGFNNRIYDFTGGYAQGYGADNGNIFAGITNNVQLTYTYPVDSLLPMSPEISPDSTYFTVKNYFSNGNSFGGLKSNDTVEYIQEFYNFYAYDDGSAEAGYDLVNSPQGKLAQRFDLLAADTLRAVKMHFVQQNSSVTNLLFTIKIWSSLNPETVIYQETNQRPVYMSQINGFSTYVLDQLVPVSGTIYVGFQQVTADGLHLGFDRNTASNSKMFYNFNGSWNNVNIANGSFMIRPVMGDSALYTGNAEIAHKEFSLYPNPANTELRIGYESQENILQIHIFSADGRVLKSESYSDIVDTRDLSAGLYIMQLHFRDGSIATQRFAVNH